MPKLNHGMSRKTQLTNYISCSFTISSSAKLPVQEYKLSWRSALYGASFAIVDLIASFALVAYVKE